MRSSWSRRLVTRYEHKTENVLAFVELHEALTGVRLGDHRLFERLHELAPDEVGDAEHPVWHLTLGV